jgi:hypothetical protein
MLTPVILGTVFLIRHVTSRERLFCPSLSDNIDDGPECIGSIGRVDRPFDDFNLCDIINWKIPEIDITEKGVIDWSTVNVDDVCPCI